MKRPTGMDPTTSETAPRLGILGGGQLAMMIAEAALSHGATVRVLTPDSRAPATQTSAAIELGSLDDEQALSRLFSRCDHILIESELVDPERLKRAHYRFPEAIITPDLECIRLTRDKLEQKRLFRALGLPTAEFCEVDLTTPLQSLLGLEERFGPGFVLKRAQGGYDGRGNLIVDRPGGRHQVVEFLETSKRSRTAVYAEALVPFALELAMVSTRTRDGSVAKHFPLVITEQEAGVCREVLGPATALGVPLRAEAQAREMMDRVASELGICGTFAMEFFLTAQGELVINEMAPRVHNSGHYTLYEDGPSQFDLHVQAVLGLPLSEPRCRGFALMRNLLGPRAIARSPSEVGDLPSGVNVHWYGKGQALPGRKMGHLTARARNRRELAALRLSLREFEQALWSELRREGRVA